MKLRNILTLILAAAFSSALISAAQAKECDKKGGRELSNAVVVYFDTGSVAIKEKDQKALNEFSNQVKEHPSIEICLVGQADNQGDAAMNEKLAKRRAEAVKTYLSGHGLKDKPYQIVVRGEAFGGTWMGKLLKDVKFESDRRVEVTAITE